MPVLRGAGKLFFEKPGNFCQYLRHFLSDRAPVGPNRNPVGKKPGFLGFSQKPGFLGVRVERMSVLAPPRNPVGKKPGFLINTFASVRLPEWCVWCVLLIILAKVLFKKPDFWIGPLV
jgi:hypothetical protein